MSTNLFKLDGRYYNVHVTSLKRTFEVTDTDQSGRVLDKMRMVRDIIGTVYNYALEIEPTGADLGEYDDFYWAISDPGVDCHTMTFPFGQTTRTFEAYITSGEDELISRHNGDNRWAHLALNFIAMEAERTP